MIKLKHAQHSIEYYAQFDDTAQVYEIFTDTEGETYVGCADTLKEAEEVAAWHSQDISCR